MDPKACLLRALSSLEAGDWLDATEALTDYREWRSRGGFEPMFGDGLPSTVLEGDRLERLLRTCTRAQR